MIPVLFGLAAVLMFQIANMLYVLAIGLLGQRLGLRVTTYSVGWGPKLRFRIGGAPMRLGPIPMGGYTQFWGEYDQEDDVAAQAGEPGEWPAPEPAPTALRMSEISPLGKMAIMLSGPLTNIALGLLLLALPIWFEARQLAVTSPDESMAKPCAVGGLAVRDAPSTWEGQGQLFRETAVEFLLRLFTFRSLENWGAVVGAFVTCGAVGNVSAAAWVSSLGSIVLAIGLVNLLPIPCLNGGHLVFALCELVLRRPLSEKFRERSTYIGLLIILILMARMLFVDGRWLYQVLTT